MGSRERFSGILCNDPLSDASGFVQDGHVTWRNQRYRSYPDYHGPGMTDHWTPTEHAGIGFSFCELLDDHTDGNGISGCLVLQAQNSGPIRQYMHIGMTNQVPALPLHAQ
eukprot:gene17747-5571_t